MTSRSTSAFAESVTVEELENDPYPIYARLRREAPVCFIPAVGLWFVTRYDDVEFVGTHPELFSAQLDDSPVDRTFGSPTIITVDGELHHELRHALDAKYRPRHVRAYIDDLVRAPQSARWSPRRTGTRPSFPTPTASTSSGHAG